MIGITSREHRGFAIHVEWNSVGDPPYQATIRRRFRQLHPQRGVFKGRSEEEAVSQAQAAIEQILDGERPNGE
jgi:hypothetical protein